jgi:ERCC4-type nuclease
MKSKIRVDGRTGSKELAKYFTSYGIQPEITKLPFGDFDFKGYGAAGVSGIVFERKRIDDLVASMQSKRLSGYQLPGMADAYDYGYLIIEGIWKSGPSGELMVNDRGKWYARGIHTRAVHNYVMGLAFRAGLMPWKTASQEETIGFIVDQYNMFKTPWEEHHAHEAVYAPAEANGNARQGFRLSLATRKVTRREKAAIAALPGLDDLARWVEGWFSSIRQMANAEEEEWAKKEYVTRAKQGKVGKKMKFGAVRAKKVVQAIVSGD